MNILYITLFYPDAVLGGIERVTGIVSHQLAQSGHRIYVLHCRPSERDGSCEWVESQCMHGLWQTDKLADFLDRNDIQCVVNQALFAYTPVIRNAIGRRPVRLITCFHGAPHFVPLSVSDAVGQTASRVKQWAIKLFYPLYRIASVKKMCRMHRDSYNMSDVTVVLSAKYIREYSTALNVDGKRLAAINNPLAYDSTIDIGKLAKKENVCLVVARLNDHLKRIPLVLRVWGELQDRKDWRLIIVGDGAYRRAYEQQARDMGLRNVSFVGSAVARPYYEMAKVYLMTSESEGWGMTLTESLQNGVLPVAMDTYAALHDIITDGENGYIVKDNDIQAFAGRVRYVMDMDDETLRSMQMRAIDSTLRFSIGEVMKQWESVLSLNGKANV